MPTAGVDEGVLIRRTSPDRNTIALLDAELVVANTDNFNGVLSGTDDEVQTALDTLDDHSHTAAQTSVDASAFSQNLSSADDTVQKALATLNALAVGGDSDGQTRAQVEARIRALVAAWALAGNTALLPDGKLNPDLQLLIRNIVTGGWRTDAALAVTEPQAAAFTLGNRTGSDIQCGCGRGRADRRTNWNIGVRVARTLYDNIPTAAESNRVRVNLDEGVSALLSTGMHLGSGPTDADDSFDYYNVPLPDLPSGATPTPQLDAPTELENVAIPAESIVGRLLGGSAGLTLVHDGSVTGLSVPDLRQNHNGTAQSFSPTFSVAADGDNASGVLEVSLRVSIGTTSDTLSLTENETRTTVTVNRSIFASDIRALSAFLRSASTPSGILIGPVPVYSVANTVYTRVGLLNAYIVRNAQNEVAFLWDYRFDVRHSANHNAAFGAHLHVAFQRQQPAPDAPAPTTTFAALTDTPNAYGTNAGRAAVVNSTNTGLVFLQLNAAGLASNSVTEPKIINGAVTRAKIGNGAVGSVQLGDNSVITNRLANDAVTRAKIGPAAVGTLELDDDAVTNAKIGSGAVNADSIGNNTVSEAKLASAVTDKLLPTPPAGSDAKAIQGRNGAWSVVDFPTGGGEAGAAPSLYDVALQAVSATANRVTNTAGGNVTPAWHAIDLTSNATAVEGLTVANNRLVFAQAKKVLIGGSIQVAGYNAGQSGTVGNIRIQFALRAVRIATPNTVVTQSQVGTSADVIETDPSQDERKQFAFSLDAAAGDQYELQWFVRLAPGRNSYTQIQTAESAVNVRFLEGGGGSGGGGATSATVSLPDILELDVSANAKTFSGTNVQHSDWETVALANKSTPTEGVTVASNRITFAQAKKVSLHAKFRTTGTGTGGGSRVYNYFRVSEVGTPNTVLRNSEDQSYNKATAPGQTLAQGPPYQICTLNFNLDAEAGKSYIVEWQCYAQDNTTVTMDHANSEVDITFREPTVTLN